MNLLRTYSAAAALALATAFAGISTVYAQDEKVPRRDGAHNADPI